MTSLYTLPPPGQCLLGQPRQGYLQNFLLTGAKPPPHTHTPLQGVMPTGDEQGAGIREVDGGDGRGFQELYGWTGRWGEEYAEGQRASAEHIPQTYPGWGDPSRHLIRSVRAPPSHGCAPL